VKAGQLFVEEQQHNVEASWQEQNTQILQEIAQLRGEEFQGIGVDERPRGQFQAAVGLLSPHLPLPLGVAGWATA